MAPDTVEHGVGIDIKAELHLAIEQTEFPPSMKGSVNKLRTIAHAALDACSIATMIDGIKECRALLEHLVQERLAADKAPVHDALNIRRLKKAVLTRLSIMLAADLFDRIAEALNSGAVDFRRFKSPGKCRQVVLKAFPDLGKVVGSGCPLEWPDVVDELRKRGIDPAMADSLHQKEVRHVETPFDRALTLFELYSPDRLAKLKGCGFQAGYIINAVMLMRRESFRDKKPHPETTAWKCIADLQTAWQAAPNDKARAAVIADYRERLEELAGTAIPDELASFFSRRGLDCDIVAALSPKVALDQEEVERELLKLPSKKDGRLGFK